MSLNERLFAVWYPWVCGLSEAAGQREIRAQLIGEASGRTLELGAGSGLNLPHYTSAVTELVVTEPSPHMLRRLQRDGTRAVAARAESIPFDDASFDTVVATYVHCTVEDPAKALAEIARVLKPGGRYLFLEHVHAGKGTLQGLFQDAVALPHRYVAAGCHPNRRTEQLLDASPLAVQRLEHIRMPRASPSVSSAIVGSATPRAAR